jgi:ATP:corrinoid adenosyltransferase
MTIWESISESDRWVLEIDEPEIELQVFWGDGQNKSTQAFWMLSKDETETPLVWMIAAEA